MTEILKKFFLITSVIMSIIVIDFWILPKNKIEDRVTSSISRAFSIKNSNSYNYAGQSINTAKGFSFSINENPLAVEDSITISVSPILKSVKGVNFHSKPNKQFRVTSGKSSFLGSFLFLLNYLILTGSCYIIHFKNQRNDGELILKVLILNFFYAILYLFYLSIQ
jgi:hypothetical protein